jgi:hypothetical protein
MYTNCWCPTRFPYLGMCVSFSSKTTGLNSGAETLLIVLAFGIFKLFLLVLYMAIYKCVFYFQSEILFFLFLIGHQRWPLNAGHKWMSDWLLINVYRIGLCCLSVKHAALRRNSRDCWLGIRIICQSGETCLLTDCCFSELFSAF